MAWHPRNGAGVIDDEIEVTSDELQSLECVSRLSRPKSMSMTESCKL